MASSSVERTGSSVERSVVLSKPNVRSATGPEQSAVDGRLARRDIAILTAEVRRLASELYTAGPLPSAVLAERCHASRWHDGSFRDAVLAGIRNGRLRRLPFDFIDVPRSAAGSTEGSVAGTSRRGDIDRRSDGGGSG